MDETFVDGEHSGKLGQEAAGKILALIVAEEAPTSIDRICLVPIDAFSETLKMQLYK